MLILWIVLVTVFPRCIWVCVLLLLFRHRQALIIKGQENRHELIKKMQNNAMVATRSLVTPLCRTLNNLGTLLICNDQLYDSNKSRCFPELPKATLKNKFWKPRPDYRLLVVTFDKVYSRICSACSAFNLAASSTYGCFSSTDMLFHFAPPAFPTCTAMPLKMLMLSRQY